MARVSYLKPAVTPQRAAPRARRRVTSDAGRPRRGRFIVGGLLVLVLAAAGAAALIFVSAKATLSADSNALAKIGMPLGGGTIKSVSVVTGPHSRSVPVELRGDQIWPKRLIPAHELLQIDVVIKRPGWVGWLAGNTQHLHLTLMTPSASLRQHYVTLKPGQPLLLRFKQPVRVIAVANAAGHLDRRILAKPFSEIRLHSHRRRGHRHDRRADAHLGDAQPPTVVSWFPAGASATALATPAPGSQILPNTPITLTFNKPITKALGSNRPPVSPTTPGTWQTKNNHTIVFQPQDYGYGLGAKVSVALPSGVRLVGGQQNGSSSTGTWIVPAGSTLRLQQLLAQLGYLPFSFKGAHVALDAAGPGGSGDQAAVGQARLEIPEHPGRADGACGRPGIAGTMTKGAIMAFQNDHGFTHGRRARRTGRLAFADHRGRRTTSARRSATRSSSSA